MTGDVLLGKDLESRLKGVVSGLSDLLIPGK